jgi:hypothetical protein
MAASIQQDHQGLQGDIGRGSNWEHDFDLTYTKIR